ncbi:hypothetical protein B4N89_36085 [Embleya scabrispora]|uniref:Uncharacterized protein n=1 Tax=Embleya scabrispora TaxID=159449 RepID=A0A1T3NLJ0_9ACTN|nr:hypothetical protein [Embleya scabrispora]OPC77717.1 hypothetical protein B4N89_36085 [Embleya scabrispora]
MSDLPIVTTQALDGVVTAVHGDPPALAADIRRRIAASREEGVTMSDVEINPESAEHGPFSPGALASL